MSHRISHASQALPVPFGMDWFMRLPYRIADAWAVHQRRAAHRRALYSLDEHGLRDLGLSHRAVAEGPHSPRGGPP